jgi:hypothetical protein
VSEITGYKPLNEAQIQYMNRFKELERDLLLELKGLSLLANMNIRWASIARTHFEQGFMAACRAITKPETIEF